MDQISPLQGPASDLCTKLMGKVRVLRSNCTVKAYDLSKSTTNEFVDAPTKLRTMATSLRDLNAPVKLLHKEIESGIPMVDLGELSASVQTSIFKELDTALTTGLATLGIDLLRSIFRDLDAIHQLATSLKAACKILDAALCPASHHRWSSDDDDDDHNSDADNESSSLRHTLHAQLIDKLASEGHQCPICLEDMADGTDCEPTITKCGHVFCEECIETVVGEQQKYPMCRRHLPYSLLFKRALGQADAVLK